MVEQDVGYLRRRQSEVAAANNICGRERMVACRHTTCSGRVVLSHRSSKKEHRVCEPFGDSRRHLRASTSARSHKKHATPTYDALVWSENDWSNH